MTPTLGGRIQTRMLLLALIGAPWTAIVTPALPRPGWVPLSMLFDIMYRGLLVVAIVGLGWELVYHALQQLRWDKDWPSVAQLLVMVNEAVVVWLILHANHTIPGTVGFSAPLLPAYSIYFASTWTLIWLVMHGPMRVIALRWRFSGARLLPRRLHDGHRLPTPRRPAVAHEPLVRPPAPEVSGVLCARGHFNHPQAPFCVRCGRSLRAEPATPATAPRPPLGALLLDTGATVVLDADFVLGAAPRHDPAVLAGRARPLTVAGAPSHLDIMLRGWQILLCDRGSEARISGPRTAGWIELRPHTAVAVDPGTTVRIADRTIVIQSHWPLAGDAPHVRVAVGGRHRAARTRRTPVP